MEFRQFRKDVMHMTQEQMAKELGVNVTTICYWETGRKYPTYKRIKEMQKRYNVELEF